MLSRTHFILRLSGICTEKSAIYHKAFRLREIMEARSEIPAFLQKSPVFLMKQFFMKSRSNIGKLNIELDLITFNLNYLY